MVSRVRLLTLALAFAVFVGCDMDQPANRFEQLNNATKELIDVLKKITDEASAQANRDDLAEIAADIRGIQEEITEGAKKIKDPGGAMIVNHRQASLYVQTAQNAANRIKQIRESNPKAGDIVDQALGGLTFEF